MGQPRYPLQALRELRESDEARGRGELDGARAVLEERRVALEHARAVLADARTRGHARAHTQGVTTGAALARAGAAAAREALVREQLVRVLAQAERALREQTRVVTKLELAWQLARTEQAVVERHHARFTQDERKRQERAADDEADELHASRRAVQRNERERERS